jgi:hypothetical protein
MTVRARRLDQADPGACRVRHAPSSDRRADRLGSITIQVDPVQELTIPVKMT